MIKLKDYIAYLNVLKKEHGNLLVFLSGDDEGNTFRTHLLEFSLADVYDGEVELSPHPEDVDDNDPPFEATALVIY